MWEQGRHQVSERSHRDVVVTHSKNSTHLIQYVKGVDSPRLLVLKRADATGDANLDANIVWRKALFI